MIPEIRRAYNAAFRSEQYDAFLHHINSAVTYPADFKITETPIFLMEALTSALLRASEEVIAATQSPTYRAATMGAVPTASYVPNEDAHPQLLQIDFGLCVEGGNIVPRLIELQGFPSLYCFQALLEQTFPRYFEIPSTFTHYFSGMDYAGYCAALRDTIVGDYDPEETILLEVSPEQQSTRIDFACTQAMIGIRTVALADVYVRGRSLFTRREGREVKITRIYNRVIRDDPKLHSATASPSLAWMTEDLDVSWAAHPNWYYKISKYGLPLLYQLGVQSAPECYTVSDLPKNGIDLDQFVLKPLFLYSGAGIQLDVTPAMIDSLPDKREFILQRKVTYAPLIETLDVPAFAEVRMLFLWKEGQAQPQPVSNLVRLSKGKMMGVKFNKDRTWVGSTLAYIPR